jgi:hypothetical protein
MPRAGAGGSLLTAPDTKNQGLKNLSMPAAICTLCLCVYRCNRRMEPCALSRAVILIDREDPESTP